MSKQQIFISYSGADADRNWVRGLAESLQRHGAKVWLDELEVSPGEPLRDAIEKGLRRSDIVVSVVTPEGIKRPNLFFELGAAVGMGKRVVAILPQGFEPTLLPQLLRTRRFLRQGSPEETARELLGQATSGEELKGERGRVEMWRGGVSPDSTVAAPFVWRCLNCLNMTPFSTSRSSNRTCGFPASGSRTSHHAFAHGGLRVRIGRRMSDRCSYKY